VFDAREFALELLRGETERDRQVHVGASQFSSPCSFCVARALRDSHAVMQGAQVHTTGKGRYWLGGVIGTAVHGLLEERAQDIPGAHIEQKIRLGDLAGYGETILSKPDYYNSGVLIDWKTTDRTKLKFLKEASRSKPAELEVSGLVAARYTFQKYLGQLMSYGRGLVLMGHPVKSVHMVFICRDGKTDDDVWAYDAPYDAAYAEKVWDRLTRLWTYVYAGNDINELPSHPGCYSCQTGGRDR
jgi:hypothetical protein